MQTQNTNSEQQKEKPHPHPEPIPPMMKILLDLTEKIGRLEGMMELLVKNKPTKS